MKTIRSHCSESVRQTQDLLGKLALRFSPNATAKKSTDLSRMELFHPFLLCKTLHFTVPTGQITKVRESERLSVSGSKYYVSSRSTQIQKIWLRSERDESCHEFQNLNLYVREGDHVSFVYAGNRIRSGRKLVGLYNHRQRTWEHGLTRWGQLGYSVPEVMIAVILVYKVVEFLLDALPIWPIQDGILGLAVLIMPALAVLFTWLRSSGQIERQVRDRAREMVNV